MKIMLEEYGVLIFFIVLFGLLINYFIKLKNSAATGELINQYK